MHFDSYKSVPCSQPGLLAKRTEGSEAAQTKVADLLPKVSLLRL